VVVRSGSRLEKAYWRLVELEGEPERLNSGPVSADFSSS